MSTIQEEIKAVLDTINAEHMAGPGLYSGEWTRRIKEELGALGKSKGYYTYGLKNSPLHCDDGEFMFDLCWLDYGKEDTWLKKVPLVMECEWLGPDDVDDDFLKLLIARADLRVMIFSASTGDEFRATVERLRRWIVEFEDGNSSDRFLLCGWCSDGRKFEHAET
ncbi:MAG: hypothetical protein RH942_01350 [Kiloniellaceae bacterium]